MDVLDDEVSVIPYESTTGTLNLDSSSSFKVDVKGEDVDLMNRSLGGIILGGGSCRISLCIVGVVAYQVTPCSVKSCQKDAGEYLGGKMTVP